VPYAELPDVRLWFEDSGGDGTPVVFFHAASGTSGSWGLQTPAFLAVGYRCIAYDRRGWGRTETRPGGAELSYFADDLDGLLDSLRVDRAHLVGVAAGGGPVLDYALLRPERVRSVVVADAQCGVQDPEFRAFSERVRPPQIAALPVELRELSASYRGSNPEGVRRWLEMEEATRPADGPTAQPQYYVLRQQYRNHITLALLETLQPPALLMVGDADLVTPPAQMRMVAQRIPGCTLAVVPEAGHAAFWEQPEAWNRLALEFIGPH